MGPRRFPSTRIEWRTDLGCKIKLTLTSLPHCKAIRLTVVGAYRALRRRGSHVFKKISSKFAVALSTLRASGALPPRKLPGSNLC
jgi:hypothetical protein